jgi:hypothetical protein
MLTAMYWGCLAQRWIFESRLLRRIYGPKREEVAGDWRGLYNEELY